MSLYSRLDRLAADVEKLNRQVTAVANSPQSQRTSVEGGSIDFNDADGNLMAIMGGQDDGSNTIRHVDGPTPPVPSGLTAHVDGPIVQVSWDGTFEDADTATYDWSHLEVIVVGPSNEQLTATINDVTGASASVAATASGEWTVVARSVSRAEKRSLDGDAGTVEVKLVDIDGAINDAIGSANGKNTVHYSEFPPTVDDPGIDGDTWFVNSVDTETQIMLITEQWQFLAGVWVQTELNHQVIATLDLGKATVGELDGIRIAANSVRGEQLSGDAIDGKVITGGTYRTSGGNGSWSDAGLFIAQPDGTSMVRFPTDGSPLSLTASDVQIDRASVTDLDLSYGAVRSGGEFTLASGVTAPPSPPELTTGWQKVASLQTPDVALTYDWLGLGYWAEGGGHWVRAVNVLGSEGDTLDEVHVYSMDGVFEQAIKTGLNPRSGVTVIGDVAYVMGPDYERANIGKQWVHGFNLNTGERVTRWEYVHFFDPKQAKVALGNDGSNLVVAGVAPTRRLHVFRYNPATGAQVSSWQTAPDWTGGQELEGVSVNSAGTEVTVLPLQTARVYMVSGTALTRKTDSANANGYAGWDNPNRNGAGMVMMAGRFGAIVPFVVDGTGAVYEGSQFTSDTPVVARFTWFDGTNETTPSPELSGFFSARESPAFSMPTRAGLQKRLYFKFGTGGWNRVTLPETLTVLSWMDALNYTPVLAAPPTTNSFPNADPATLKSTNNAFEVKGDGSGKWGPLTFNADGSMSGMRRMAAGRVTITPTATDTAVSVEVTFPPGRFTTAPAVTVTPDSSFGNTVIPLYTGASSVTATSFVMRLRRNSIAATTISWIATEVG